MEVVGFVNFTITFWKCVYKETVSDLKSLIGFTAYFQSNKDKNERNLKQKSDNCLQSDSK